VGGKIIRTRADDTTRNDSIEFKFSTKDLASFPRHSHPNNMGIPFFDRDLAKIFYERSILKVERIFETLLHYKFEISEKDIPCLTDEIGKNMLIPALEDEIKRYRTKPKNRRYGYEEDIERARKGNNESLLRLVEWDKGWLFIDWVKNRILQAQEKGDTEFIKVLGEAVGAQPRIQIPIAVMDREDQKLIIFTMEAVIPYYLTKKPSASRRESFNRVTKVFFDALQNWESGGQSAFINKGIGMSLDYFRRYIKRHLTINLD
jgi:hypothetical protein